LAVKEEATGSGFPLSWGNWQTSLKPTWSWWWARTSPGAAAFGWKLMEAKENENFRLVLANLRKTKFDRYADLSLRYKPGASGSSSPG